MNLFENSFEKAGNQIDYYGIGKHGEAATLFHTVWFILFNHSMALSLSICLSLYLNFMYVPKLALRPSCAEQVNLNLTYTSVRPCSGVYILDNFLVKRVELHSEIQIFKSRVAPSV